MTPDDSRRRVAELVQRGVHVLAPEQVYVGADVDLDRISAGATLYPGTRLHGARTFVGPAAHVGREGPAMLEDAVLGDSAVVASGYVKRAVLLTGAQLGANAHVREGTLLEEQASTGHAVGLKQSVLLAYATLGSLINFCDALIGGGTSRREHSEIGSGFIHFNFTPWGVHGDKATPSLVGDVVEGSAATSIRTAATRQRCARSRPSSRRAALTPADRNGNTNTNAARAKPYDWLLASDALDEREVAAEIGAHTFANGIVLDTGVYQPIAELATARASDSGAAGMQHMAIVRDFEITGDDEPDPEPEPGGQVILNEILANEPGSDPTGEFVELVNVGTGAVDLAGFTLSDTAQVRHVVPAGTLLPAGARQVIAAATASTHALGLSNSGDTVTLRDANGLAVDAITFGSAPDGVSLNRSPDLTGTVWALHTALSSAASSPGTAP